MGPPLDSEMRYRDLREWIDAARDLGEVRDVTGATWQEDIGRVTEMLHHTDDSPAVLFDDIPGYPSGFRILANANATRRRLALTFGLPLDIERRPAEFTNAPIPILRVPRDEWPPFDRALAEAARRRGLALLRRFEAGVEGVSSVPITTAGTTRACGA